MKDNNNLIRDIKKHLDQSADALDSKTLAKIRAARFKALEETRSGLMSWVFPLSGVAVAAVVLLVALNLFRGPEHKKIPEVVEVIETGSDKVIPVRTEEQETLHAETYDLEINPDQLALIEMLSDDQQLDLFENIDFYTWVAENENTTG